MSLLFNNRLSLGSSGALLKKDNNLSS
ncbi:uncharacterized protein METZ01_LOCUS84919 [marine metagenome]|uniref:Uncharacterized protein n=1 Tax=marine metagenome TaxID=408172 RepID=A0A381UVA5_9ZZZZ